MRYIAQDVSSGEFLNWNMPLGNVTVTYPLSGPQEIAGELSPELPHLNLSAYEEWATWLHAEQGGHIRASGILQPLSIDGPTANVAAVGFTGYAHGMPYLGEYSKIQVDPLDAARQIWVHLQSYPNGLHGVTLDGAQSPIRIGEPEHEEPPATEGGEPRTVDAKPYQLVWWSPKDCGDEFNSLAKETPFDYREDSQWNTGKTDITHHINLGYPRLGRKRDDLRFAQGENLSDPIPYTKQDTYASEVHVLGAGEGRKRIHAVASEPGEKLRRVVVIENKDIETHRRAKRLALDELRRRQAVVSFEQVTVDTSDENARWGTFSTGDDIRITGEFPWLGRQTVWHRITSITFDPDAGSAALDLVPSASVYYGPGGAG